MQLLVAQQLGMPGMAQQHVFVPPGMLPPQQPVVLPPHQTPTGMQAVAGELYLGLISATPIPCLYPAVSLISLYLETCTAHPGYTSAQLAACRRWDRAAAAGAAAAAVHGRLVHWYATRGARLRL